MNFHALLLFVLLFRGCGGNPPPQHYVSLRWNPSPSQSPTLNVEYNVYRAQGIAVGAVFLRLNPAFITGTTFNDTSVAGGMTYKYFVRTVAGPSNVESIPSNIFTVTVPSP